MRNGNEEIRNGNEEMRLSIMAELIHCKSYCPTDSEPYDRFETEADKPGQ